MKPLTVGLSPAKTKLPDLSRISQRLAQLAPRCSEISCDNKSFSRLLLRRRLGYFLGSRWFCSAQCLEKAIVGEIVTRLNTRRQFAPRAPRIPLGLQLFSRGIINTEQLNRTLAEQRKMGCNIGDAMIKLGFATEVEVASAAAAQWGLSFFRMESWQAPDQVRIPYLLMEHYKMLPVHFNEVGKRLLMGFVRAPHPLALKAVEEVTQCAASACFITASAYDKALRDYSTQVHDSQIVFDRSSSPAEIGQVIRNYVIQSGAGEACIGVCMEYLWARVHGAKATLDLLFRLEAN